MDCACSLIPAPSAPGRRAPFFRFVQHFQAFGGTSRAGLEAARAGGHASPNRDLAARDPTSVPTRFGRRGRDARASTSGRSVPGAAARKPPPGLPACRCLVPKVFHGYLGSVCGFLLAAACMHDCTPKSIPPVSENAPAPALIARGTWEARSALVMRESPVLNRLNPAACADDMQLCLLCRARGCAAFHERLPCASAGPNLKSSDLGQATRRNHALRVPASMCGFRARKVQDARQLRHLQQWACPKGNILVVRFHRALRDL